MTIVPATEEILRRFHPEPLSMTVRAIAAMDGERVLGVTGFYPDQGRLVMFAGIDDEARKEARYKRGLVRCARMVMEMAEKRHMPIDALADPAITGSDVLLEHLGFTRFEGVYRKGAS